MKPVYVKSNAYTNSGEEINNKNPKFEIGDIVRISKSENIFGKGFLRSWSVEVLVFKKVKNTVPWTMLLVILKAKKLLERFTKKIFKKKQNKKIKKSLELKY